jgi:hypothetical protein
MRHVTLVVGSWFGMMHPGEEFDVDEDVVVEDVVVEDVVGEGIVIGDVEEEEDEAEEEERERIRLFCAIANFVARYSDRTIRYLTFCARPQRLLEGRGSCQLAFISTTPSPAISKDTRTILETHLCPPRRKARRCTSA